jgi:phosphatidylglycerophosphate synthase
MAATKAAEADTGAAAVGTRPPELEDWMNRVVIHPISRRVALALRHTPVTPNMVSCASGLSLASAGLAYTLIDWPMAAAAGFSLYLLWHVFDGADGDLARLTGRSSPTGELVDGIADYSGHMVLYIAFGAYLGGWGWFLSAAAAFSRIAQASHIETVRRTYLWRAYGVPWLGRRKPGPADASARISGGIAGFYLAIASALAPRTTRADALIEMRERDASAAAQAHALARRIGRNALAYQYWLGPNRRTLLLGLSMAAGSPVWFLIFEATLLNVILLASAARQRAVNAELASALELSPMMAGAARKD